MLCPEKASADSTGSSHERAEAMSDYDFDDDDGTHSDGKSTKSTSHSKIEKHRRDKQNAFITEICHRVPMCSALSARKMDKLTVLRIAVQYIRSLKGSSSNFPQHVYKPPFLSEEETKTHLQAVADGFLLTVCCERGKILHASDAILQVLGWPHTQIAGRNVVEILHPDDILMFKSQIATANLDQLASKSDQAPSSSSGNSATPLFSPGSKRWFSCRLRRSLGAGHDFDSPSTSIEPQYELTHCTGFLKTSLTQPVSPQEEPVQGVSLVAYVRRAHLHGVKQEFRDMKKSTECQCRWNTEGKMEQLDNRLCHLLGYSECELTGRHVAQIFDRASAESIQKLIDSPQPTTLPNLTLVSRSGHQLKGSSLRLRPFVNPWTRRATMLLVTLTLEGVL